MPLNNAFCPGGTDATGHIQIEVPVARGRYDVQVFTASTSQAAETESEVRQVVVD